MLGQRMLQSTRQHIRYASVHFPSIRYLMFLMLRLRTVVPTLKALTPRLKQLRPTLMTFQPRHVSAQESYDVIRARFMVDSRYEHDSQQCMHKGGLVYC